MTTFKDSFFQGMNVTAQPEALPEGFLTSIVNMMVVGSVGGKGGYLQTRPGLRGQLTTPLGVTIYEMTTFVANDGSRWGVFTAGSSTTGQLYRWAKGATSVSFLCFNGTLYQWRTSAGGGYTAVLFNAPAAQMAQNGYYLFVVGAIDGFPRRIFHDWTVDSGMGFESPLYTPKASLSNFPLANLGSATLGWDIVDYATGGQGGTNNYSGTPGGQWFSGVGSFFNMQPDSGLPLTAGQQSHFFTEIGWTPTTALGIETTLQSTTTASTTTTGNVVLSGLPNNSRSVPVTLGTNFPNGASIIVYTNSSHCFGGIVTAGGGTTTLTVLTTWESGAVTVGSGATVDLNPGFWLSLDDQGSFVTSTNPVLNIPKQNVTGAHGTGAVVRYPVDFKVSFLYAALVAHSSVIVKITAFSDTTGTTQIGLLQQEFANPVYGNGALVHSGAGPVVQINSVFSFAGLVDETQLKSFIVTIGPGTQNTNGKGPFLTAFTCEPLSPPIVQMPDADGTGIGVQVNSTSQQAYLGGQRITIKLGSTQDWSGYSQIALLWDERQTLANDPNIYIGFRSSSGGTTNYASAPGSLQQVGSNTYLSWNLSTMPSADLTSVLIIEILFQADVNLADGTTYNGLTLFGTGPMVFAGNLTFGEADYTWRVTERNSGDTIESGGSPISNTLTTTAAMAEANVLLPTGGGSVPMNTGTGIAIWRTGGIFDDGQYRLVAVIADPTMSTSGTNWIYTVGGPDGPIFADDVPDSDLINADELEDHEPPPTNAIAVGVWQGRVVYATVDAIAISQLIAGAAAPALGLYFNSLIALPVPTDPNYNEEGDYIPLTDALAVGAGQVQRLVKRGTRLDLMFVNARFTLSGTNPGDFSLRQFEETSGSGVVGPHAVIASDAMAVFLSQDGVRASDFQNADLEVSKSVTPFFAPGSFAFSETALNAGALAQAHVLTHAGRIYVSVPTASSGSNNGVTLMLDRLHTDSWVQWNLGSISSGCVFRTSADTDDLFFADALGQIYSVAGNAYGDKATPSGTLTAVAQTATSRGFIVNGSEGARLKGERISVDAECADSPTVLALSAYGDDDVVNLGWMLNYSFAVPKKWIKRLRVLAQLVRGRVLNWSISASTINPLTIRRVELETSVLVGKGRG